MTEVRVGVMDSTREGTLVSLPVHPLGLGARVRRALVRLAMVSGPCLLITPIPFFHLCGPALALTAGPIAAVFAFRGTVLVGPGAVRCPRCEATVPLPSKLAGWPARAHCASCGAMVELKPS